MEPFIPRQLPPDIEYSQLTAEIANSHRELGNLSGLLLHPAINPNLLITPLLTKEAVLSSAVEGTVATLEDVFLHEAGNKNIQNEEIRRDAQEIINYRNAIEASISELENRAIGENLLKKAHYILLKSVRGTGKDRGNYRNIGRPGSAIKDASFIPPPYDLVPELMSNWEAYINSTEEKDTLVQIAVAHYQFEAIHPFLDGNGRIGRMLIPLFLCERKLLKHPILYISQFFEKNRDLYIDLLHSVDESKDWLLWIKFFLTGLRTQALETQTAVLKILILYKDLKDKVTSIGYSAQLLDIIFVRPIITYSYLKKEISASSQTIYNLLDKFEDQGILISTKDAKRNRQFIFRELLDLL
jgi:Fic family protein